VGRRSLVTCLATAALAGGAVALALGASSGGAPSLRGIPAKDARAIVGYRSWQPLAERPVASLRPLGSAHVGGVHKVYVNRTRTQLSRSGEQRFPYPKGSVVVKEGLEGRDLELIAIMRKVAAGSGVGSWSYVEYTRSSGSGPFSRVTAPNSVCTSCHLNANSKQRTDWVFYSLT